TVGAGVTAVPQVAVGEARCNCLPVDEMHGPLNGRVRRGQFSRHAVVIAEYPEPRGLPFDSALGVLVTALRRRAVPPSLPADEEVGVAIADSGNSYCGMNANLGNGHRKPPLAQDPPDSDASRFACILRNYEHRFKPSDVNYVTFQRRSPR